MNLLLISCWYKSSSITSESGFLGLRNIFFSDPPNVQNVTQLCPRTAVSSPEVASDWITWPSNENVVGQARPRWKNTRSLSGAKQSPPDLQEGAHISHNVKLMQLMHIPEKITLVPHIWSKQKLMNKATTCKYTRDNFSILFTILQRVSITQIQQTMIQPALGPNVSSSNSCWNLGRQWGIGGSKGSITTSFGMSAMALALEIALGSMDCDRLCTSQWMQWYAVAYLLIEWPYISHQWPDNMAQHGSQTSWAFESTSQNAVSLRNHFSQAWYKAPRSLPSALTLSVTRCGTWPGEAMLLPDPTRLSLSPPQRRQRQRRACGLLPCVGLVSLNLREVATSSKHQKIHLITLCSWYFLIHLDTSCLDFFELHFGDEKRCGKYEPDAKQKCIVRLLRQPSLWGSSVVRMLWISFFTHLSTRSTKI